MEEVVVKGTGRSHWRPPRAEIAGIHACPRACDSRSLARDSRGRERADMRRWILGFGPMLAHYQIMLRRPINLALDDGRVSLDTYLVSCQH